MSRPGEKDLNSMPPRDETYLSVIIPAYNKESVIETALARSIAYLSTWDYNWEIVVVDDASTDATVARIRHFLAEHPEMNIRLLLNERNRQKGGAIRRGVTEAAGKYALFIDADYAYPVDQVDNFLEQLEQGFPLVIGNRTDPASTYLVKPCWFPFIYLRYLLGRSFNLLVRTMLLRGIQDTQCGIKAVQTSTARGFMEKMTVFNFAYDVELIYIFRQNGRQIAQVPVTYDYIDEPSSVKLLRHSIVMFRSLLRVRLNGWTGRYILDDERKHI
jgi:dolichyl-phosphate beta-glucosyltransferase